jgi:hypothetical protein
VADEVRGEDNLFVRAMQVVGGGAEEQKERDG